MSLALFAVGILFVSINVDRVQAQAHTHNHNMMNLDYSYINSPRESSKQKQEIIDLMKIHHSGEGENHYRQMYGSDSGAYCKIRCRSPTI